METPVPWKECSAPIRVLLVDDEEYVLWGLGKLIGGEWPRMTVSGTAKSIPEALAAIREGAPNVVVLDIFLGGENSLDHLPELLGTSGIRVLVLTGADDVGLHRLAIARGACAVVLKDQPADVLLQTIEGAHARADGRRSGA